MPVIASDTVLTRAGWAFESVANFKLPVLDADSRFAFNTFELCSDQLAEPFPILQLDLILSAAIRIKACSSWISAQSLAIPHDDGLT